MIDYKNLKLFVKAKKTPIINNPIIEYIEDKNRNTNRLYCEIYWKNILIAKGVVLDFYKEFENIEDLFII
jgi:hypothetical protein